MHTAFAFLRSVCLLAAAALLSGCWTENDAGETLCGKLRTDAIGIAGANFSPIQRLAPDGAEGAWRTGFRSPGLGGADRRAHVLTEDSAGRLYVGGTFTEIGGTTTEGLAMWDGMRWHDVAGGLPGTAQALAIDPADTVYAGLHPSNGAPPRLARFDGDGWLISDAFADDSDDYAEIDVLTPVCEGVVLVGGSFTRVGGTVASGLVLLDGDSFKPLGDVNGAVRTILLDADRRVCIGGSFSQVGDVEAWNAACFDGETWSQLGVNPPNGEIYTLARGANGEIYAGGAFTFRDETGNIEAKGLALLDDGAAGGQWRGFEGGIDFGTIDVVRSIDILPDGDVVVGGTFGVVGALSETPVMASHLARFDLTSRRWSEPATVRTETGVFLLGSEGVYAVLARADGSLAVAGYFSSVGEAAAEGIAAVPEVGVGDAMPLLPQDLRFDGIAGSVEDIEFDADGRPIVSGRFSFAGAAMAESIARYGEHGWEPLGASPRGRIATLHRLADGTLLAGGDLESGSVMQFDGTDWEPFGRALDNTVYDIGQAPNGDIYACGNFTQSGVTTLNGVARWNGTRWTALGGGLQNADGGGGHCTSLLFDPDGRPIVSGVFNNSAGQPTVGLAVFDGAAWQPFGTGLAMHQLTDDGMQVFDGFGVRLVNDGAGGFIVAGWFDTVAGTPAKSIARFDGAQWIDLGAGLVGTLFDGSAVISDVTLVPGGLIATGTFASDETGEMLSSIAFRDGATGEWRPLGAGLSDYANRLRHDGATLWVGGSFTAAGGRSSAGFAAWDFDEPAP